MRWWPKTRKGRTALTIVALLVGVWTYTYRPWQAHYLGRPTAYWAGRLASDRNDRNKAWTSQTKQWLDQVLVPLGIEWTFSPAVEKLYDEPDAVPVLIELLSDTNPHVQARAARYLGALRRPPEQALPALLQAWRQRKDKYPY